MNKVFIGLLIVAVAGGSYYLLSKKKKTTTPAIQQELIIGKWENSTAVNDSVTATTRYEFNKEGQVIRLVNDSTAADTSFYAWNKTNELVWKQQAADSTGKAFAVALLTKDSLQLRAADSTITTFTKLK